MLLAVGRFDELGVVDLPTTVGSEMFTFPVVIPSRGLLLVGIDDAVAERRGSSAFASARENEKFPSPRIRMRQAGLTCSCSIGGSRYPARSTGAVAWTEGVKDRVVRKSAFSEGCCGIWYHEHNFW